MTRLGTDVFADGQTLDLRHRVSVVTAVRTDDHPNEMATSLCKPILQINRYAVIQMLVYCYKGKGDSLALCLSSK